MNLETALGWIKRVKPGRAFFTHMAASLDYEQTFEMSARRCAGL